MRRRRREATSTTAVAARSSMRSDGHASLRPAWNTHGVHVPYVAGSIIMFCCNAPAPMATKANTTAATHGLVVSEAVGSTRAGEHRTGLQIINGQVSVQHENAARRQRLQTSDGLHLQGTRSM